MYIKSFILSNPSFFILFNAIIANVTAQIIKFFVHRWKTKESDLLILFSSGGMPSSHTAFVVSSTVSIGMVCGISSSIFALSLVLALIVIFDSLGIRRHAGKQAQVLNNIVNDFKELTKIINSSENISQEKYERKLKEFLGHEPIEVLGGIIHGIIITFFILFILNNFPNLIFSLCATKFVL